MLNRVQQLFTRRHRLITGTLLLWACGVGIGISGVADAGRNFQAGNLLPADTLFFISAREWTQAREALRISPYGRLWHDPALRAFRQSFEKRFTDSVLNPIERELDIRLDDYTSLLKGSVTFALINNGAADNAPPGVGWLLLADTADKADECRRRLSAARKRWMATGKAVRTATLDGHEFTALSLGTNSALNQLRALLPLPPGFINLDFKLENGPDGACIWLGQVNGILVLGASSNTVEKVLPAISGAPTPVLASNATYAACHNAVMQDAVACGWLSTKPLLNSYAAVGGQIAPTNAPDAVGLDRNQLISASGLSDVSGAGFAVSATGRGFAIDLFVGCESAERKGLLRLLAGNPREVSVPAFIPADAIRFQRWRMDGGNAWMVFQKMMSEISPQWTSTIDFIIETANQAARFKEASFDLRKSLLGNFGDDFMQYSKISGSADSAPGSESSIWLVGSPGSDHFASALQRVLIFLSPEAENPVQREFLGRRIYSVPLPSVPLPFENIPPAAAGRTLHYSATSNYVVLTTDTALLEEFLHNAETNASALENAPGVREAVAAATAGPASLFLIENQRERFRTWYEEARKTRPSSAPVASSSGSILPQLPSSEWMDFSLLPPFEQVENHFGILARASKPVAGGIQTTWIMPSKGSR